MASIERTAYPRLKSMLTKNELDDFYAPTEEKLSFVRRTARKLIAQTVFEAAQVMDNPADLIDAVIRISNQKSVTDCRRSARPTA